MLHELLLALHGIAGGVFSESTTETENDLGLTKYLIPISKSLPLIPQGELVLYTKLLRLGTCYGYLERFVRNFSVPNYGLYVSAFAFGIDASLSEYRADLHSLETELLMHADLGASHLCYRLHSYNILLPILVKITKKVKNIIEEPESLCDNPSCRVLDVIISATPAGLLGPRFTIQKLVYHVVQVLYRQLLSWLIYGVLHDPYSEFFIKRVNPDSLTFMELSTYSPVDVSVTDDSLETKPVFVVDVHRIPSFLSTLFAQRVLATGEVMCFISSDPSEAPFLLELEKTYYRGFSEIPTCFEESGDKQFDEKIFRNPLDVRKINNLVCEIHNVVSYHAWHSLMNKHKLVQYLHLVKDVLLLGRGELFLAFFDQLNISSDLSDLESEINFKITHNILDKPPPTDDSEIRDLESNITAAFLGAARSLGLNDEMLNTSFKFLIRFKKASHEDEMTQNLTVWDCLHIQITVPSPLECLFSAQICCAYDRLFRFVSSIRRTQLKLQHYWADQILLWRRARDHTQLPSGYYDVVMSRDYFHKSQSNITRRLLVRSHMAFIIENLLYYLQVDAIESQFSQFIHRLHTEQEIELIQIAHEAFLAGLQAQALLFMPNVKSAIMNLLNICCQFVNISDQNHSSSYDCEDTDDDTLENIELLNKEQEIIDKFYHHSESLYKVLDMSSGVKSNASITYFYTSRYSRMNKHRPSVGTDLRQLLSRLDFNFFYSKSPENLI